MIPQSFKSLSPLILILFSGCSLFDSGADQIVDGYEVAWIDDPRDRSLQKGEQLIPPYVFGVGHNAKYIFAERHAFILVNGEKEIDESTVYYYIIERTKNSFQDKPMYGPLSKNAFVTKCNALGIKQPDFDQMF